MQTAHMPFHNRATIGAQRDHLLLLFFAQDIAHVDGGYSSRQDQRPELVRPLVGFQPIIIGRFGLVPEGAPAGEPRLDD
jgi:hypothetical protein